MSRMSERTKNPLNVRFSKSNNWKGKTGENYKGFECFIDDRYSVRAAHRLMSTYQRYGIKTIAAFIRRYAPNNENNTELYIKRICEMTKLNEETLINDENIKILLLQAMAVIESGSFMSITYIKESIAL